MRGTRRRAVQPPLWRRAIRGAHKGDDTRGISVLA